MRKEENMLIGWEFIEYLEPENSAVVEGWNFLNSKISVWLFSLYECFFIK